MEIFDSWTLSLLRPIAALISTFTARVTPYTDPLVDSYLEPTFAPFYDFVSAVVSGGEAPLIVVSTQVHVAVLVSLMIVAAVYRILVHCGIPNPLRHIYNFFFGFLAYALVFKWTVVHLLLQVGFSYMVLRLFGRCYPRLMAAITLTGLVAYQSLFYLLELHVYSHDLNARYLIPITIATMKLSSIAFSVRDGMRPPSLLRYLGFAFFYGTITTGPTITAEEYFTTEKIMMSSTYIHRGYVERVRMDKEIALRRENKKKNHVGCKEVATVLFTLFILLILLFVLTDNLTINPATILLQANFQQYVSKCTFGGDTFCSLLVLIWGLITFRVKEYFKWKFAEGICFIAGFKIRNCSICDLEFSSIGAVHEYWNIQTFKWIRRLAVQIRFPDDFEWVDVCYCVLCAIMYFFSSGSFWFYLTYAVCFFVFVGLVDRQAKRLSSDLIRVPMFLLRHIVWGYVQIALMVRGEAFAWYRSIWFCGHVFVLLMLGLILVVLAVSERLEKKRKADLLAAKKKKKAAGSKKKKRLRYGQVRDLPVVRDLPRKKPVRNRAAEPRNPRRRESSGGSAKTIQVEMRRDPSERHILNESMVEFDESVPPLGEGAFSSVRKGWLTVGVARLCVAVKVLKQSVSQKDSEREVFLTASLEHPNIVTCYGCWHRGGLSNIVFEFCDGGTITDYLRKMIPAASAKKRVKMLLQFAKGVAYLHSKKVIHRDLKPANVLVHQDVVKIADFGISKNQDTFTASDLAGTPIYIPPKMTDDPEKADTYAFAIIAWQMWTFAVPFEALLRKMRAVRNVWEIWMEIHRQEARPDMSHDGCRTMPRELKTLIMKSWDADDVVRPWFPEIVQTIEGILSEMNRTNDGGRMRRRRRL